MNLDIDRLTSDEYLSGISDRSLDAVRSMRSECEMVENALSLARRVVQGRLDIVGGEISRRNDGREVATASEVVAGLPGLLADTQPAAAVPRPPQTIDPSKAAIQLIAELDAAVPPISVSSLGELSDMALAEQIVALDAHEQQLSHQRRAMHVTIDSLQGEVARRYRSGEASVDSLLT